MIILDFGSGGTCLNDWDYTKRMIDTMMNVNKNRRKPVIIKWQLFKEAGDNVPLKRDIFEKAYQYAKEFGYETTASVFDLPSLTFLLKFDIPFVKIANNRKLDFLIEKIPKGTKVIKSIGSMEEFKNGSSLCCVSKYPATIDDYEDIFGGKLLIGISDHTEDWELYLKYAPLVYECHFCLDDSRGFDAGSFARRPWQLEQIL
jgi:sialic acid synthase SpsE